MAKVEEVQGRAALEGELWGARAGDWAELQETQHRPLYEEAIRKIGIGPGTSVLDVGCGSGLFCRLAADAGAEVSGLDASALLLEIARERIPEGEFRLGDLDKLPYPAHCFDRVTGFTAFNHAEDFVGALVEARRVTKPGGAVFVLIWGREERTDMVAFLEAIYPLVPPAPPEARSFALSYEGALDTLVAKAGLTPGEAGYLEAAFEYQDQDELLRALTSAGLAVLAIRTSGEEAVRWALAESMARFRRPDGRYVMQTEWRYVLATPE